MKDVYTFDDQRLPTPAWFLLHLCSRNDVNGNPCRCYVLYNAEGSIMNVWDEGYDGKFAVPEPYRNFLSVAPRINVTHRQYLDLTKVLYNED